MAFLAPVLGAAIGGVAASAVGQAVIGVGLSVAAGYAARTLAPKPQQRGAAGHRLNLRHDPNAPREIGVGLFATAGSLVYRNVFGQQDYTEIAYAVSDFPCSGLVGLIVGGRPVTLDPASGAVAEYPGMWVTFHAGGWDQVANANLVANSADGRWTANHRGRGVSYVVVTMQFNAELYPSNVPDFLFILQGAPLYDWRQDSSVGGEGAQRWNEPGTHAFTRNPSVIAYNWCRGLWLGGQRVAGMNMPAGMLPLDWWTAAANANDEAVALKAGGTEPRYCADGLLATASPNREVLRSLATAMAGRFIDTGGLYYPVAGVSQAPVLPITDDDLLSDADIELIDKLGRDQLVNAVFGSYHEPGQQYAPIAAPPRISPDDEASDGSRLERHYPLDLVTSGTRAQRILEIFRREGRYQGTGKLPLRARCRGLEAGDVFAWTSARYGYVNKLFRVATTEAAPDGSGIVVTIAETAAAIYGWTPASDELDPQAPMVLPSGGAPANAIEGLQVANVVVTSAGVAQLPGLALTWTPPTDPTVIGIRVQYRRQGDDVALEAYIYDARPLGGNAHIVTEGVQGGTVYEVAMLPVTMPERAGLTWTSWVVPSMASEPQIVDVAAIAVTVPDDSITPEKLDAQTRKELERITGAREIQDSVEERLQRLAREIVDLGEAHLIRALAMDEMQASVRTEIETRQSLTESFALYRTEVEAMLNDPETGLPSIASAVFALETRVESSEGAITDMGARATIGVNVNNQVTGVIDIAGNLLESVITMLSDRFVVAKPDGTGATQIFTTGTSAAGENRVVINGNLYALGSILASHLSVTTLDAISANFGVMTAGRMLSPDGKVDFNLTDGYLEMTA